MPSEPLARAYCARGRLDATIHHGPVAGVLRAFNAETLAEIWNSEQNIPRDRVGTLMKFVPPVVAKGRVFIPNQDNQVAVYGLIPVDYSVTASPGLRAVAPGGMWRTVNCAAEWPGSIVQVAGWAAARDGTASASETRTARISVCLIE